MATHMTPRMRHVCEEVERTGARVVALSHTGSGHVRLDVEVPSGTRHRLVCACSSSDWRSRKNLIARVKRWVGAPVVARAA
jgi:hypothetical protein